MTIELTSRPRAPAMMIVIGMTFLPRPEPRRGRHVRR